MLRIALPGAAGRMGRALIRAIAESKEATLAAAVERPGHPDLGRDAGEIEGVRRLGIPIGQDLAAALTQADVWIDFTAPDATAHAAELAAQHNVALVVGTTGLERPQRTVLEEASRKVPVMISANMLVGVAVLARLVEVATRSLGPSFDVEILELHHRQKKDAPSGTALLLGEASAAVAGHNLAEAARYGRDGLCGPRTDREMGILAVRGGDVVGDHTVFFLGTGERLELTHRASSRETFARGALRAALWIRSQPPGLYSMQDVLGLR